MRTWDNRTIATLGDIVNWRADCRGEGIAIRAPRPSNDREPPREPPPPRMPVVMRRRPEQVVEIPESRMPAVSMPRDETVEETPSYKTAPFDPLPAPEPERPVQTTQIPPRAPVDSLVPIRSATPPPSLPPSLPPASPVQRAPERPPQTFVRITAPELPDRAAPVKEVVREMPKKTAKRQPQFNREEKLAVLERIERGESAADIARELRINDSVISGWKLHRSQIEAMPPGGMRNNDKDGSKLRRNQMIAAFVLNYGDGGQAAAARKFKLHQSVVSTIMQKYHRGDFQLANESKTMVSKPESSAPRSAPTSTGMDALVEKLARKKLEQIEAELDAKVNARVEQLMAEKLGG